MLATTPRDLLVPRYLRQVTLNTNRARNVAGAELDERELQACAVLLARALDAGGDPVEIPGRAGYYLAARGPAGKCLALTIAGGETREPIGAIGIAAHSRCGVRLWRQLHDGREAFLATDRTACPAEPWAALALERSAAAAPPEWLEAFTRGLAAAWLRTLPAARR